MIRKLKPSLKDVAYYDVKQKSYFIESFSHFLGRLNKIFVSQRNKTSEK